MSLYSAAWRTAGAGSTTLPIASLYAVAGHQPRIREIAVFNTVDTAVALAIRRLTTAGTPGAGQTEVPLDDPAGTALATAVDTHTVGPTIAGGNIRVFQLAAAIGAGVILPFGGGGLVIPAGTANGVGIVVLTGTGQICDVSFTWEQ
jgi:hypothetical protein